MNVIEIYFINLKPEETGETSRIFRRRHMESNWSRYEGLEESLEENVEIRGIDFEKVTKVAGLT